PERMLYRRSVLWRLRQARASALRRGGETAQRVVSARPVETICLGDAAARARCRSAHAHELTESQRQASTDGVTVLGSAFLVLRSGSRFLRTQNQNPEPRTQNQEPGLDRLGALK